MCVPACDLHIRFLIIIVIAYALILIHYVTFQLKHLQLLPYDKAHEDNELYLNFHGSWVEEGGSTRNDAFPVRIISRTIFLKLLNKMQSKDTRPFINLSSIQRCYDTGQCSQLPVVYPLWE